MTNSSLLHLKSPASEVEFFIQIDDDDDDDDDDGYDDDDDDADDAQVFSSFCRA